MALDFEDDGSLEQDCSFEALEAIQGLTQTTLVDGIVLVYEQITVADGSDYITIIGDRETGERRRAERRARRQLRTERQGRAERHARPLLAPRSLSREEA